MDTNDLVTDKEYPNGAPLYWMYEQSGRLAISIRRFINRNMLPQDFEIVRKYYEHWIFCPNWKDNGTLESLKGRIKNCKSDIELYNIALTLPSIGIDPL